MENAEKVTLLHRQLQFVWNAGARKVHVRLARKTLASLTSLCGRTMPESVSVYTHNWLTTDDLCAACMTQLREKHPSWIQFTPWTDKERIAEQRKAMMMLENLLSE